MERIIAIYMALINIFTFVLCIYDKRAAIRKRYRISEKKLFGVSMIGGALGMFAAMLIVRHKTKHWYFMVFMPMLIIAHVALILYILHLTA